MAKRVHPWSLVVTGVDSVVIRGHWGLSSSAAVAAASVADVAASSTVTPAPPARHRSHDA